MYSHQLTKVSSRIPSIPSQHRIKGALNIYYVMMDPSYTTVSNPESVDGWLGLYVGDHLWYNLFSENSVETTANEIGTFACAAYLPLAVLLVAF